MRIGIVTPFVLYHSFAQYFDEEDRDELFALKQNDNAPIPSVIAQGLIQKGHFVRLFTNGQQNRVFRSEKVEIVTVRCDYRVIAHLRLYELHELQLAYKMSRVIGNQLDDLDLLHAHWTYYTALAAGRHAKRLPVFCTVRDWCPTIRSFLPNGGGKQWKVKHWENELTFRNKHIHFIGNSPYTQQLIEGKTHKEVPFIMNPIDDACLACGEKARPDHLHIVCVTSSIDRRKNITRLLEAYRLVRKEEPTATLTCLFGYSINQDTNPFFVHWREQGLLDGVEILFGAGHEEVLHHIDRATLTVSPSLEETFGNTIVESMARRTPVVGGKESGAVPLLLDFGTRGYVCDVTSAENIANTIIHIHNNPDEAHAKASEAYEWLKDNVALDRVTDAHIDYFSKFVR